MPFDWLAGIIGFAATVGFAATAGFDIGCVDVDGWFAGAADAVDLDELESESESECSQSS